MRINFKPSYLIHAAAVAFILAFLFWPGARQESVKVAVAPKAMVVPRPVVSSSLAHRYQSIVRGLDISRVRADVGSLSSYKSRVAGYPGSDAAADYVQNRFKAIGLDGVKAENFDVTVPVDEGSKIVAGGRTFNLHALWPNSVRTSQLPPEGLSVHLIDAGRARLIDFDDKPVEESAALVDFNCGDEWLNAPRLGAKAVIFVEPDSTMRWEAEAKFCSVPVSIPRFWISRADAAEVRKLLKRGSGSARLFCWMPWKKVPSRNIIATIRGTDPALRDQWVVLQASYDGTSVVPSLAPSAEATCGIASLMELARLYKTRAFAPKRSVMFLATGAHFQALAGIRAFVERHIDSYAQPGPL